MVYSFASAMDVYPVVSSVYAFEFYSSLSGTSCYAYSLFYESSVLATWAAAPSAAASSAWLSSASFINWSSSISSVALDLTYDSLFLLLAVFDDDSDLLFDASD